MILKHMTRVVAALILALGLAACGVVNARTQPVAPADYVSPALIGPEPHAEQPGEEGTEEHSDSGTAEEGAEVDATAESE